MTIRSLNQLILAGDPSVHAAATPTPPAAPPVAPPAAPPATPTPPQQAPAPSKTAPQADRTRTAPAQESAPSQRAEPQPESRQTDPQPQASSQPPPAPQPDPGQQPDVPPPSQSAPPETQPDAPRQPTAAAAASTAAVVNQSVTSPPPPAPSSAAPSGSTSAQPVIGIARSAGSARLSAKPAVAPATPAQARPADSDDSAFAAQITRGLASALAQRGEPGKSITLRLNPDSLGFVRIEMGLDGGAVSARIEASTPEARQLLDRSLASLRQSLEARGLNVDRLQVQLAAPLADPSGFDPGPGGHPDASHHQGPAWNAEHAATGHSGLALSPDGQSSQHPSSNGGDGAERRAAGAMGQAVHPDHDPPRKPATPLHARSVPLAPAAAAHGIDAVG